MHASLRRLAIALAAAALAAGCSQPEKKPAPPVEATPRNGVVGLVSEVKYREPAGNEVVGPLNEIFGTKKDPATQWEVTVFYDDGTTGTLKLATRPPVRPGQKVRVTGDRIEPR